ncbi:MAG: sensor histidine kinase [Myxococcota bacterium]
MSSPIRPDQGDVSTIADSDGRRLEADRLRRALDARDDFLAAAAHELRTPIGTMLLHVESIAQLARDSGSEALAARVATLQAQMRHYARRATTLLDVSVLLAGKLQLRLELLDVAELVGDVIELVRVEAERAGSSLTFEALARPCGAFDRTRLEQVALNLLSNAIKYGAGEPIRARVETVDDHVLLTIVDKGIGISAEDQTRIFGRFERVPFAKENDVPSGGFGVGLWIVKEIVDAMGGTINVVSRSGEGSSFTVALPLTRHRDIQ